MSVKKAAKAAEMLKKRRKLAGPLLTGIPSAPPFRCLSRTGREPCLLSPKRRGALGKEKWYNGNTDDSGSSVLGSSPGFPANKGWIHIEIS